MKRGRESERREGRVGGAVHGMDGKREGGRVGHVLATLTSPQHSASTPKQCPWTKPTHMLELLYVIQLDSQNGNK